ncbi:MAG: hypothetical protein GY850_21015, partial [bacterium]|nr:hypothetical protein [bacterium]
RQVIALRKAHPVFRRTSFFTGLDLDGDQFRDIHWYDSSGRDAYWGPTEKWLMCTLDGSQEETGAKEDDVDVLMIFNADEYPRLFHLPPALHHRSARNGCWRLLLDTGLPCPGDIHPPGEEIELKKAIYRVKGRSMVVMISK